MSSTPSALASIRNRLLTNSRLSAVVTAPLALGVSLAGSAAQADEVLSTNRNTSLYTSQSTIRITNTGSITDSGTGTDPDDMVTGIGIQSSPGWTFTNDGTIHITGIGQFTQADAVYASSSGTITNNGLISAPNAYVGIYFMSGGSNKAAITNNGTIIGNLNAVRSRSPIDIVNGAAGNTSALIKNVVSLNYPQSLAAVRLDVPFHPSTITNYGTIEGARDAISSTGTVAITNYGKIVAAPGYSAINLTNGMNSSVTLKDGSLLEGAISSQTVLNSSLRLEGSGSLSGAIKNFSTLTLDGTDWTLAAGGSTVTDTAIDRGVLRVNGGLTSAVAIGGAGTLAGTGMITGNVNTWSGSILRPGSADAPGTLTVTGDYTQVSGSTLVIQTTPTAASALTVIGNTSLAGDLAVEPTGAGYGNSISYTILTAAGTLSGGFSSITSSDISLTPTASVDIANKQVVLTLTPAQRLFWDGDAGGNAANSAVDGGSGTWSAASTNWTGADGISNGTLLGSPMVPVFHGTAGTVTVDGVVTAAGLTVGTNGYHFTGGSIDLTGAPVVTVNAGTTSIASMLTGSAGLTKAGSGTLLLSGANSYAGATAITGGTLTLAGGSALLDAGAVSISADSTLNLAASETIGGLSGAGNVALGANTLTVGGAGTLSGSISGTGGLVKSGSGALTLSGSSSYTGGTMITGGTLAVDGGSALPQAGAVSVGVDGVLDLRVNAIIGELNGSGTVLLGAGSPVLTIDQATDSLFSGSLSGNTGSLVKTGAGALTLGGTSSLFSTAVQGGTLRLDGALTSRVEVGGAGTLTGTGSVTGNLTAQAGSTVQPGAAGSLGTLNVTGNYIQQSGATLAVQTTPTTASQLAVGGSATLGGALSVISTGQYVPSNSYDYTILTAANGVSGTFSSVTGSDAALTPTVTYDVANKRVQLTLVAAAPPSEPTPTPSEPTTPPTPSEPVPTPSEPTTPPIPSEPSTPTPSEPAPPTPSKPTPTPSEPTPSVPSEPTPTPSEPSTPDAGVIDTSRPSFGNKDEAVQSTTVTFAGGTLKPAAPLTLTQAVKVESSGGTITPNGSAVTLAGTVSGAGSLSVSGAGALVVTNNLANTGGLSVQNGAGLTVGSGGSVGTSVTADHGVLTVTSGGQISAPVHLGGGSSAAVSGSISGPITLTGNSSLALDNGGVLSGALRVAQGTASIGGIVAAPVTVSTGGSLNVVGGGGVGGTLAVEGGVLTVASNGVVNGAVNLRDGGTAVVGGAVMAPVTVESGSITVDVSGSVGALTMERGAAKVNGLAASSLVLASGAALSGSGTVLGPATVAGVLSPGNSPGVMTFRSPVTLTGSAVYQPEIDGPTAGTGAGHHDQTVVQGGSFTAAGTLAPVLRGISGSASNSYTPSLGQRFTVIAADGGVQGSFAALTQPTAGLAAGTRMDALYGADSIQLVVTPAQYAQQGTRNQQAVGAALDIARPTAGIRLDGAGAPLYSSLYGLDQGGIANALDQLSGKLHADMLAADLSNRRLFGQALNGRLAALRGGDPSSTPGVRIQLSSNTSSALADGVAAAAGAPAKANVWAKPLASFSQISSDNNAAGAINRAAGVLMGVDHGYEFGLQAGVALGFLHNHVTSQDGLGRGNTDSYQASLYGSWDFGAAFLEGTLGYGHTRYSSDRDIGFGVLEEEAEGKSHGHDFSAEAALGRRLSLGQASWVEPRAGLQLDRITRDGFIEEGGSAVLDVNATGWTTVRSALGARVGTAAKLGGWSVRSTLSAEWKHDFADVTPSTSYLLNGVGFTADGSRPGRDALVIGAGLGVQLSDRVSASLELQEEIRKRQITHAVSAGVKWAF